MRQTTQADWNQDVLQAYAIVVRKIKNMAQAERNSLTDRQRIALDSMVGMPAGFEQHLAIPAVRAKFLACLDRVLEVLEGKE